jgi:hypothetical protein
VVSAPDAIPASRVVAMSDCRIGGNVADWRRINKPHLAFHLVEYLPDVCIAVGNLPGIRSPTLYH